MSRTMQSATLLLFLPVIVTAVAAPASLGEAAGCEWRGQHYREGETIYPDRCQLCLCHNGTVQCSTPPCQPAPCPETIPDPEQCGCPACPPDYSCRLPNGTVIPPGQAVLLRFYAICHCDDHTQSPTTITDAVCQYIVG